ncbi:MAG: hypothetical protein SGJ16_05640 [Nitrospirota bacterium]|nr:hypothetical protein [Nitrospirota bacterium]
MENDKHLHSDIVTAFSLAIVAMCRALEQQQKIMPRPIAAAIQAKGRALSANARNQTVKTILTSIAKGVNGKAITPVRLP